MSDGPVAQFVSFERFLERRRRLATAPLADNAVPPVSTDPADSGSLEKEARTMRTAAVAAPAPERAAE